MMSLWDALRMNMMISYQELVRTFLSVLMQDYSGKIIRYIVSLDPVLLVINSAITDFITPNSQGNSSDFSG
ncbi:hypothetical protein, partial [Escherichia coli]|uniref:hypothetical protein n=1 Tax=Escherichia coli TaxID=562 RepID=UPI0020B210CD